MSDIITYVSSVYSRDISYTNFKGETKTVTLDFSLAPLQLMSIIAGFETKKVKSGNPAKNGQVEALTSEAQLVLFTKLASSAAGFASEDGETWEPFENFEDSLAGKAFLTKLAASDGDRKEFAELCILSPFRAFTALAIADPTNSPKDVLEFQQTQSQMEKLFAAPEEKTETAAERRARLQAELDATEIVDIEKS